MSQQTNLKKWASEELARLNKERREIMDSKGYADFWTAPEGETQIHLLEVMPRAVKGQQGFGDRVAFRIDTKDGVKDWAVNPHSPIYRNLVSLLETAPAILRVVRTGSGKNTRYTLLTLDESLAKKTKK